MDYQRYRPSGQKFSKASSVQLLSDVYGLPVVSSERPASFIKEKVMSTIAERCRHATLRDVFKASTKKRVKEVCDCLMDSSPLYPRVLLEILNACPSMVARSLVDKFSSATSILKLIASMAGYARAERMWKRATYLDGKLEKLRMRVICTDPVSSQWLLQDTPATITSCRGQGQRRTSTCSRCGLSRDYLRLPHCVAVSSQSSELAMPS